MITIGLSWLLFWLLIEPLSMKPRPAILVVAVVYLFVGLLNERPWNR